MDPEIIVTSALTAIDEIVSLINHIRAQKGLTTEEIAAIAEEQDLQNAADIKRLLAL
jgi:hypothetical protein